MPKCKHSNYGSVVLPDKTIYSICGTCNATWMQEIEEKKMLKFVLNKSEEIPVHLEIFENHLELVVTGTGRYLVSIEMSTGLVTVNENTEFGLKYNYSIK